jgi:hypothetical protein
MLCTLMCTHLPHYLHSIWGQYVILYSTQSELTGTTVHAQIMDVCLPVAMIL